MVTSVTMRFFEKISGIISTPTFTDLAVRKGDVLNLGSSAIERLSAPRPPLNSDRLRLPTSTLRPNAVEAFCSMVPRNWFTGIKNGATRTNTINTPTTMATIFKVRLMRTSVEEAMGNQIQCGEGIVAHPHHRGSAGNPEC